MMVATAESISAALAALRERKSTALMASPMRPSISAATSALIRVRVRVRIRVRVRVRVGVRVRVRVGLG